MTQQVTPARPCPGSCNKKWRAAEKVAAQRAWSAVHHLRPLSRRDVEIIEHPEPVSMGDPIWCTWCSAAIADAIWRLIELAAGLWAVGHDSSPGPRVVRVVSRETHYGYAVAADTMLGRVSRGGPALPKTVIGFTEKYSCRHSARIIGDRLPPAQVRKCWQCSMGELPDSGRLVPPPPSARAASGGVAGSPALSPSLLAVDELVAWAIAAEDYLRTQRLDPRSDRRVVAVTRSVPVPNVGHFPSWVEITEERALTAAEVVRSSSSRGSTSLAKSSDNLSAAVRYLASHHDELLATPRAAELGLEVLGLERRAERQSGMENPPTRLGTACPTCDHRALWARATDRWARCRNCGAYTSMEFVHTVAAIHGT